jgi:tetratricopeptide (TPR) repeat protein
METRDKLVQALWQRIYSGRHAALVGATPPEPPPSMGLLVVRVRCDVPPTTLGPLLDARAKIERLLGGTTPILDQAKDRVVAGLRRRLLGDMPTRAEGVELVEAANRMAEPIEGHGVIVFEAVEAADPATLETLRKIVSRPGWIRLPLLLAFRTPPEGPAAALLDMLAAAEGSAAIVRLDAPAQAESARPPSSSPPAAVPPPAATEDQGILALPPDVRRVLRAGALIGSGFEISLVAELLGIDALDALDAMQHATDLGVPVEDLGEGRFHLPDALIEALRRSTLPSLALTWHRTLALLLGSHIDATRSAETQPAPAPETPAAEVKAPPVTEREPEQPIAAEEAAAPQEEEEAPAPASSDYADLFEGEARAQQQENGQRAPEVREEAPQAPAAAAVAAPEDGAEERAPEERAIEDGAEANAPQEEAPSFAAAPPPVSGPRGWVTAPAPWMGLVDRPEPAPAAATASQPPPPPVSARRASIPPVSARADDARAASHLAAAGEVEASAERYRAAAEKAASVGAFTQALAHLQRAATLIGSLPATPSRRRQRTRLLVAMGRLQAEAAGPDPAFTLPRALMVLEEARASLSPDEAPELRTEIATLVASVCYDLGDMRSLERALDELVRESRLLLDAGDAVGAARLLNDQAAVYVRMGDPVRAVHLLTESRTIFEQRAPTDPVSMVELAETDHLLARIPLHVPPRPGREQDALSMGLDHALAAERAYKRLGAARELGRVWETMGRLELHKGRLDRAAQRLGAALSVGQQIGDLVGLARASAAMSEVLAASGRMREAIALLGESVTLNLEKGSPIGLAFNRRALAALEKRVTRGAEEQGLIAEVRERLASAEEMLGRIPLPGERD